MFAQSIDLSGGYSGSYEVTGATNGTIATGGWNAYYETINVPLPGVDDYTVKLMNEFNYGGESYVVNVEPLFGAGQLEGMNPGLWIECYFTLMNPDDPASFTATVNGTDQIDLVWTQNASNDDVIVAWSDDGTFGDPLSGTTYAVEDIIAGGGTVLYNGINTSYNHTGLDDATSYYYKAWSTADIPVREIQYSAGITDDAMTHVATYPFTEDFEGTWTGTPAAPSGWTVINNDGDDYTWTINYSSYITPHSGSSFAYGAGNNDDYLITPLFDLSDRFNARIKWWTRVYESYNNTYDVLVSTTTNEISSFTDNLGTYHCTNVSNWIAHTLDLSAYDGETIYIAFHQTYSAGTDYEIGIDDVTIEEKPLIPALIISEVADPGDNYEGRFVELYNASVSEINFSNQTWYFDIQADGATHYSVQLTGTLSAGETYVIGNASEVDAIYGAGTTDMDFDNVWGDGNDGYFLFYDGDESIGTPYDAYGVIGEDGTAEAWEYTNSRAVRGLNVTVNQGNQTWTSSEWTITEADVSDCTPGILDNDQTLPVNLSSFYATYIGGTPTLYWTTQSEENNDYWNVYRGTSQNFETAAQINAEPVPGNGTTNNASDYIFVDTVPVVQNITYWYWIEDVSTDGETEVHEPITLEVPFEDTPNTYEIYGLHQNYPNPFNPSTSISFNLDEESDVELIIYNIKGEKVRAILSSHVYADQVETVIWDGNDTNGKQVSSGVYYYKLITDTQEYQKKMLLVK